MKQTKKTWSFIKHLKPLTTDDEIDISDTLEKIAAATIHNNSEYLESVILDSALFFNKNLRQLSKAGFLSKRKRRKFALLKKIKYLDIEIDMVSNLEAKINYLRHIQVVNLKSEFEDIFEKRYFKLRKLNNVWKILESGPVL